MARPKKTLTDDHIGQIEALSGYGLTEAAIAHIMAMHPNTFRARKEDDERVSVALEKGKAIAEGQVGKALYVKAIGGDLGAICWWEKTRAGRKEVSRQEHTGADGQPIKTEHAESPRGRLFDELDRIADRQTKTKATRKAKRN